MLNFENGGVYKVIEIINSSTIKLNTVLIVKLLGVKVVIKKAAISYLKEYVLKKEVFLKFDNYDTIDKDTIEAYVF